MALTLVAVVVYWLNINGPLWIDYAALIAIGFLIYGPIMIIGLHALDLVPKKAAGTAAGFTGFFGYVFGSAIAGTGVGWIADHWGWNGVFVTMVVCCVLTMAVQRDDPRHTATSHKRASYALTHRGQARRKQAAVSSNAASWRRCHASPSPSSAAISRATSGAISTAAFEFRNKRAAAAGQHVFDRPRHLHAHRPDHLRLHVGQCGMQAARRAAGARASGPGWRGRRSRRR